MKELAGAGSPYDFELLAKFRVKEPLAVERQAHRLLRSHHFSKEWFSCSPEQAVAAVTEAAAGRLMGTCSAEERSLAGESLVRWRRLCGRLRNETTSLQQKLSSLERSLREKHEQRHSNRKKEILSTPQMPKIAQYVVLLPLAILASIASVSSGHAILLISIGWLGALAWGWLESSNEYANLRGSAYQDLVAEISESVRFDMHAMSGPLKKSIDKNQRLLALCETAEKQSSKVLSAVEQAICLSEKPDLVTVTCGNCSHRFRAFSATNHICPKCASLLG